MSRLKVRRRAGYVLLMVVGLIAICSMLLTEITRHRIKTTRLANATTDRLQEKWGAVSLEMSLCHNFRKKDGKETIDSDTLRQPRLQSPLIEQMQIQLGERNFSLWVYDEQAKLNLFTLLNHLPLPEVKKLLQAETNELLCHNHLSRNIDRHFEGPDRCWGHLFDLANTPRQNQPDLLRKATSGITLWGRGGRLNYERCTEDSFRKIASQFLSPSEVAQFWELSQKRPVPAVDEIARELKLSKNRADAARKLLTHRSSARSTWIISRYNNRLSAQLTVEEQVTDSQMRRWRFAW